MALRLFVAGVQRVRVVVICAEILSELTGCGGVALRLFVTGVQFVR